MKQLTRPQLAMLTEIYELRTRRMYVHGWIFGNTTARALKSRGLLGYEYDDQACPVCVTDAGVKAIANKGRYERGAGGER